MHPRLLTIKEPPVPKLMDRVKWRIGKFMLRHRLFTWQAVKLIRGVEARSMYDWLVQLDDIAFEELTRRG